MKDAVTILVRTRHMADLYSWAVCPPQPSWVPADQRLEIWLNSELESLTHPEEGRPAWQSVFFVAWQNFKQGKSSTTARLQFVPRDAETEAQYRALYMARNLFAGVLLTFRSDYNLAIAPEASDEHIQTAWAALPKQPSGAVVRAGALFQTPLQVHYPTRDQAPWKF